MEERTIVNTMGTSAPEVANEKRRLFGSFCEADNALCYRLGAERLFITPWGENSLGVHYQRTDHCSHQQRGKDRIPQ